MAIFLSVNVDESLRTTSEYPCCVSSSKSYPGIENEIQVLFKKIRHDATRSSSDHIIPSKRLFKYVDGLSLAIYIVTLEFTDSDGYFLWLEIYSDFTRAIIQVRVL